MRIYRFVMGLALLVLSNACSQRDAAPASTLERVAAVKAKAHASKKDSGFCDVRFSRADAPTLKLPAVEGARSEAVSVSPPTDRWVWVNVWATWCGPCRKEMPVLVSWEEQLTKEGHPVEMWWLSVDEDKDVLRSYLHDHPKAAVGKSYRLLDFGSLDPWLRTYGIESAGSIPIQIVAAPGGKVRCLRLGSVHARDYGRIKEIVSAD